MTAILSECRKYRYRLERQVSDGGKTVVFIGINPSTADASEDDATVRKMRGFCERWGGVYRFVIVNLFAFRATDPKALKAAGDPVGIRNNHHQLSALFDAHIVVPCWGRLDKVPKELRSQVDAMHKYLDHCNKPVFTLGRTQCNQPRHPLMLAYDTPLEPWK